MRQRHSAWLLIALAWIAAAPAWAQAITAETLAKQAILLDMTTGAVLLAKNADEPMGPASMSKMMTAYLMFDHLKKGRLAMDDTFTVSENAWRRGGAKSGGSTMFLDPGSRVKVEDLVRGIIIQSGNDASIVVAEALSGSEQRFAEEMTKKARELGMAGTTFTNSTGLPDEGDISTARDLAILAERTIRDFPEYYRFYAEKEFAYNGINQPNRNPLLFRNVGADGLKTGHTEASGYGIAATAERNGRRLILVVNGLPSIRERARESERLVDWGFREFDNYALFKAGEAVGKAKIWLGTLPTVEVAADKPVVITLPRAARRDMKVTLAYEGPVPAPIAAGTRVATLRITAPGVQPIEVPLVASAGVERLGTFGRLAAAFKAIVWGVSG